MQRPAPDFNRLRTALCVTSPQPAPILMGSGHSVQDYVPVDNYRAMIGTAREHGQYPIDIPSTVIEEAEAAARASHRDTVPELGQSGFGPEDDERMMT